MPAPDPSAEARRRSVLRSVDNALALLEAFSAERAELGVTELSRALGLGKSTVHRLLGTLASRGYVLQDPKTEKYRLGLKAFEVGTVAVGRLSSREVTTPFLQRLMAATRETVHLGVLDGWEVVYIDKIESQQTLRMYSRIGRRAPLHCTALGKALLAFRPEEEIDRFLRRRLKSYTPQTLTAPGDLKAELAGIRARGYAIDDEEFDTGLKCIAAPVRDHTGEVVASVGIAGAAFRLPAPRVPALADLVREAAQAVSTSLGFQERR